MNPPRESAESPDFDRILEAIEAAKIRVAQAKIRVQLQGSTPEMVSYLMEYFDAVKKLSSLENELLIMYLFEVKAGMVELGTKIETLRISAAGRF